MNGWPTVALGELIKHRKDFIVLDDNQRYKRCRVQLHTKGIVLRDVALGLDIKTKRQQACKTGEFLVAEIDAKMGGFGMVPDSLDGAIVSSHYFLFEIDDVNLDKEFLDYFCRSEYFRSQVEAQGSTNYSSIRPSDVLGYKIQLPSLTEQQTIVIRLNQLADKVRQVNEHLAAAERDAFRLLILMATRRDLSDKQRKEIGWKEAAIGDFIKLALFPVKVDANEAYQNIGIYSFARGLFEKPPIEGTRTSAKTLYQIRSGQFIYSRLFAFEGAYALVPPEYDGFYVSNEFPTFDIDLAKATPSFLITLFLTEQDWQELAMSSKGVGDRRLRIQPDKILHRKVWLPPLEDQKRIEKLFDAYHALKAKHAKIRKANQALIPATLELLFSSNQDKVNTN